MTKSAFPVPKLRVTFRSWIPRSPQDAQSASEEVDRDDEKRAGRADFDDGFRFDAVEGETADDGLDFAGLAVPLPLDDLAGEDNVFEVESREVVIFELFSCVNRYDVI